MKTAAPGPLEHYGASRAGLRISDMALAQSLQPGALRSHWLKFREKIVAAMLCCDYLRMSIRLISSKRPISVAGEKNEKSFRSHKPILNDISTLFPFHMV